MKLAAVANVLFQGKHKNEVSSNDGDAQQIVIQFSW